MKSLEQIKKELHEYIDNSVDENGLTEIYEKTLKLLESDSKKDNTSINDLISNHQKVDSTENKKDKELKRSINRWSNEGGNIPD